MLISALAKANSFQNLLQKLLFHELFSLSVEMHSMANLNINTGETNIPSHKILWLYARNIFIESENLKLVPWMCEHDIKASSQKKNCFTNVYYYIRYK